MADRFRKAIEGESFFFDTPNERLGEQVVVAKAEGNNGQWVCCTCGIPLAHQLEKDNHVAKKPRRKPLMVHVKGPIINVHVLAWRNFETGNTEVP